MRQEINQGLTAQMVLDQCELLKTDFFTEEEFCNWMDSLEVQKYIGIDEKYSIANIINIIFTSTYNPNNDIDFLFDEIYKDDYDLQSILMGYEVIKTVYTIFQYLGIPTVSENLTAENYDLIFETGLYDYVINECVKDYTRLEKIIDRVVGIDNISLVKEFGDILNDSPTNDKMKEVIDTMNSNSGLMEKLTWFNHLNNPIQSQVADVIRESSLLELYEEQKSNKDNLVDFQKEQKTTVKKNTRKTTKEAPVKE